MNRHSTASTQASDAKRPTHAYTVAMVAERWGTSDTFVYGLINAGSLEAFRLGAKLIRIRPEAVEEYERRQAEPAPDPTPAPPPPSPAAIGRMVRRGSRPR